VREKHHSQYQSKRRFGSVVVRDYRSSNHKILSQQATSPDSGQTVNKMKYAYIRILFVEVLNSGQASKRQ